MSEISADLRAMPKVELHVHLEGTISAQVASGLAVDHGEDPATALRLEDGDYPRRYRDFHHFLEVFLATTRQIRTPDDLARIAAAFARQQADQNVLWSEVTLTAGTLVAQGMDPDEMWAALRDGFAEVPDVHVGLIVDSIRELGVDNAANTVRLVEGADAPIVGLGLTGVEGSIPEAEFRLLRDAADRLGLGLTVHAGETGTADNVRSALDDLGADRIGHGIAAASDEDLLARLADEQVVVEVCPSSNVKLRLVADLDEHPLPQMVNAGVAVTINSDDPPFFATTITDEIAHAIRLCAPTRKELAELQRRAIGASFAPDEVRAMVRSRIDSWVSTTIV